MADLAVLVPRQALISDLETRLVNKPRVKNTLITFVRLTEEALASAPKMELPQPEKSVSASEVTRHILTAIAAMRRLLMLEQWRSDNVRAWQVWWKQVAGAAEDAPLQAKASENVLGKETLTGHLARLSDAIGEAQPYRAAADALGRAWISGRETHRYQRAQNLREAITRQLAPLKLLGGLAEAQARLAIETLSEEIGSILERMHRSGGLAFKGANLQRRAGLQVRGGFANGFKIDATLVANTSWLRAVLWAFLFALRNEAVKQMGSDPLPLLVLDDPQATFDAEHRNRWANEIIGLQAAQIPVQVLLTTYDETFVDLVKIEGVGGREAIIVSAGPELGRVGIFEGASIDRQWAKTQAENTPAAGQVYIADVRVYVEGLLRLMLSGHTAGVNSATKGLVMRTLRDKICELNNAKLAPWDKSEFKRLASQLEGGIPAIKQMEMAHHSGRGNLGMSEARGVEEHWRKHLSPALQRAFHLARDYQLIHGGLRALHATDPNCALPEGYTDVIRNLRLRRVGRAAAFTGGRIADGRVDLNFNSIDQNTLVLGGHFALRLNAPTLEPVARIGDILLIREVDQPSPNSLVVARYEGKVIARRFEIAEITVISWF